MKTTRPKKIPSLVRLPLLLALTVSAAPGILAQTDDFNSGDGSKWSHVDLSSILPAGFVTYTFPSDGAGGKAFQVQLLPTPPDYVSSIGPARALSYRPDVTYTGRFAMGVDVIGWDDGIDQAFGPFWYAQNLFLGGVNGYVFTYDPVPHELLVSAITSEQRSTLTKVSNVVLTPGARYRFTASSADGTTFLTQVFSTSDTNTPLWSTITQDSSYTSGYSAVLAFDGSEPPINGANVTYDNYAAAVPAANTLGPAVTQVSPAPGEQATGFYPTLSAGIYDRDTTVDTSKILLWLDGTRLQSGLTISPGVQVPGNSATFSGATVTYPTTTLLPAGAQHTNTLAYADSSNTWKTNSWTWTSAYPYLRASNSLPVATDSSRGLSVRLVRADPTASLPNSIDTAEAQLATPATIASVFSTNYVGGTINYTKDVAADPAGIFPYDSGFPGIDPSVCVNVAMEATAWLALPAGLSRLGIKSDDGFKLTSGSGFSDPAATVLGYHSGGTYDGTFQFITEAAGLYPVRLVFNQGGGGAYIQFYSMDATSGNPVLINDTQSAAIPAYLVSLVLESSPSLSPPNFTVDTSAVIDSRAKVILVPSAGSQHFYRLRTTGAAPRITSIRQSGGNIVMSYQ